MASRPQEPEILPHSPQKRTHQDVLWHLKKGDFTTRGEQQVHQMLPLPRRSSSNEREAIRVYCACPALDRVIHPYSCMALLRSCDLYLT